MLCQSLGEPVCIGFFRPLQQDARPAEGQQQLAELIIPIISIVFGPEFQDFAGVLVDLLHAVENIPVGFVDAAATLLSGVEIHMPAITLVSPSVKDLSEVGGKETEAKGAFRAIFFVNALVYAV